MELLAVSVWIVLHNLDYYLTIRGARLYEPHYRVASDAASYELNPVARKIVDGTCTVSVRHVTGTVLFASIILAVWFLAVPYVGGFVFNLCTGMLFLPYCLVIPRHARNLALLAEADPQPSRTYSSRAQFRVATVEFLALACLFFTFGFLFLWNWFFIGGAIGCALHSRRYWILSKREVLSIESTKAAQEHGASPGQTPDSWGR